MLLIENIRLALFSLRANKMRALLTMLGIIIGIAAVISIMTVGDSVTNYVTDTMSSMGASNITVALQQRMKEEEKTEKREERELGPNLLGLPEEKRPAICYVLLLIVLPLYFIFLLDWFYLKFFV